MNTKDITYCAGFFDGEGSISIIHQRCPRVREPEHRIHVLDVGISNTFREPLDFIQKVTGFGIVRNKPIKGNSNWKQIHLWYQRGPRAAEFLKIIYPYLKVKKEFATIAIEFQEKLSKGIHNQFLDRTWQNEYCQKIRNLNYTKGSGKNYRPCWFISTMPVVWNKKV